MAVVTEIDPQGGTDESIWAGWSAPVRWPTLELSALDAQRVVVLAAHPDDEVLGAGGLVALLAVAQVPLCFVWATDGEASHPRSTATAARTLAATRRAESETALAVLGVEPSALVRFGLPDGGLDGCEDELVRLLGAVLEAGDLVLAPFRGDAHPDHEACARAAAAVAPRVLEFPVWAWNWARPDDDRVPWERARRVELSADVRARKAAAVACFRSQIEPFGPAAADGPVLPASFLAHFARDFEVVLQ